MCHFVIICIRCNDQKKTTILELLTSPSNLVISPVIMAGEGESQEEKRIARISTSKNIAVKECHNDAFSHVKEEQL